MTSAGSAASRVIGATSVARVVQADGIGVVRDIEAGAEVQTASTTDEGVRAAAEAEVTLEAMDVQKKCVKEDASAVANADIFAATAPKTARTEEDMVAADATRTDDPGVDRTRAVAADPPRGHPEETSAARAKNPTLVPLLADARDRSREAPRVAVPR